MKKINIIVDKENKAIIAMGECEGKPIKVVAACREDGDIFDEEFGRQLVRKRFIIKARSERAKTIEKKLRDAFRTEQKLRRYINEANIELQDLKTKNFYAMEEARDFVNDYYAAKEKDNNEV